ncbi:hypothetical protein J6590_034073 [Homalodisca vitripennis]|nr:hypothetical protein J6590_034073 [Homalodisca vitripennis]
MSAETVLCSHSAQKRHGAELCAAAQAQRVDSRMILVIITVILSMAAVTCHSPLFVLSHYCSLRSAQIFLSTASLHPDSLAGNQSFPTKPNLIFPAARPRTLESRGCPRRSMDPSGVMTPIGHNFDVDAAAVPLKFDGLCCRLRWSRFRIVPHTGWIPGFPAITGVIVFLLIFRLPTSNR